MSIKLTNQRISITIKLTLTIFAISNIFAKCTDDQNIPKDSIYPKVSALNFSEQYLLAVKSDQSFIAYQDTLASLNLILLKKELDTFDKGLCFWINMYNATVQSKAKNDTTTFKDRNAFFKDANISIGGAKLSIDNIEHNILHTTSLTPPLAFDFATFKLFSLFLLLFQRKRQFLEKKSGG